VRVINREIQHTYDTEINSENTTFLQIFDPVSCVFAVLQEPEAPAPEPKNLSMLVENIEIQRFGHHPSVPTISQTKAECSKVHAT